MSDTKKRIDLLQTFMVYKLLLDPQTAKIN